MRGGEFQNVGGDGVLVSRGNLPSLNKQLRPNGGCGGGDRVPARGQVLPPDHECAAFCSMLCCGCACPGAAVSFVRRELSSSEEEELSYTVGGRPGRRRCRLLWIFLAAARREWPFTTVFTTASRPKGQCLDAYIQAFDVALRGRERGWCYSVHELGITKSS